MPTEAIRPPVTSKRRSVERSNVCVTDLRSSGRLTFGEGNSCGSLRAGGALSELTGLQEELTKAQANLEELRNSYRIADEIASGKAGARRARQTLLVELQEDQRERDAQLRKLIGRFEEFSARLYDERVGSLEIGSSENGPTFSISIEAGRARASTTCRCSALTSSLRRSVSNGGLGRAF